MVLLKYAIVAVTFEGYLWLNISSQNGTQFFYEKDFKDAYLFDYLQTAQMTCDIINELEDGASTCKVCSVNVIINED